jgi:hypothetical protein
MFQKIATQHSVIRKHRHKCHETNENLVISIIKAVGLYCGQKVGEGPVWLSNVGTAQENWFSVRNESDVKKTDSR